MWTRHNEARFQHLVGLECQAKINLAEYDELERLQVQRRHAIRLPPANWLLGNLALAVVWLALLPVRPFLWVCHAGDARARKRAVKAKQHTPAACGERSK